MKALWMKHRLNLKQCLQVLPNQRLVKRLTQREQKLPIDYLTDAYISDIINSSPRCREIMKYRGRECCSTVVKVSTFWGRNFILSGSECGHLIAWDRNTGKPALAIKADTSVVNRIIPHPLFPMIAVSGIDRSIKIIEPDPNIYEQSDVDDGDDHGESAFMKVVKQHEEEASQICQANEIRTKKMLSSGNNHLDSIARLRAGRGSPFCSTNVTALADTCKFVYTVGGNMKGIPVDL
ncbi:unnamed protein product [Schistosoma margrebowiei]|uniref:Uncharacterized protein n=1 Tax=Schistosoma margrebowiei TaxID=48269 RepID=A0A183M2T3_9TREM|nr:unnamed protein product [Schistosoma margrebowiei]